MPPGAVLVVGAGDWSLTVCAESGVRPSSTAGLTMVLCCRTGFSWKPTEPPVGAAGEVPVRLSNVWLWMASTATGRPAVCTEGPP